MSSLLSPAHQEALQEEFSLFVEQLRRLGWKEPRPWREFFLVFKIPARDKDPIVALQQRVNTNFLHFRANYCLLSAAILLVRVLTSPAVLISIIFCLLLSFWFILVHKKALQVGDLLLDQKKKAMLAAGLSLVILGLSGALEHLLWGVIYAFVVCGLHMIFRPRNITSKSNKVYEEMKMSGWFDGFFQEGKEDESSQDQRLLVDPEDPASEDMEHLAPSGSVRRRTTNPILT